MTITPVTTDLDVINYLKNGIFTNTNNEFYLFSYNEKKKRISVFSDSFYGQKPYVGISRDIEYINLKELSTPTQIDLNSLSTTFNKFFKLNDEVYFFQSTVNNKENIIVFSDEIIPSTGSRCFTFFSNLLDPEMICRSGITCRVLTNPKTELFMNNVMIVDYYNESIFWGCPKGFENTLKKIIDIKNTYKWMEEYKNEN